MTRSAASKLWLLLPQLPLFRKDGGIKQISKISPCAKNPSPTEKRPQTSGHQRLSVNATKSSLGSEALAPPALLNLWQVAN